MKVVSKFRRSYDLFNVFKFILCEMATQVCLLLENTREIIFGITIIFRESAICITSECKQTFPENHDFSGKVCLHSSVKNCGFPEDDGSSKNYFTLFHLYSPKVNKVELLFHIKFTCKQYFHHFSLWILTLLHFFVWLFFLK